MEQIFFRSLYALLIDKQVVKITVTRTGDNLTLLINKDNKLITMTGNPEEVDNGIVDHLKVTATPTEQSFNVQVSDAPEEEEETESKSSGSSSKKSSSKKKAASKPPAKKPSRNPNMAYKQKMEMSESLQVICGSEPLDRVEVIKKVWEYIKKNGLQGKGKNTRIITADESLAKVFGKKTVSMFEMTKLINKHLKPSTSETSGPNSETDPIHQADLKETAQENGEEIAQLKEKLKEFTETMDLGKRAMEAKNYDEAIKIYELAESKAPDGNTKATEQKEKAQAALEKHIQSLKETEFKDLMAFGLKQREERKYEDSMETFKKAQGLFPDNPEVAKQLITAEKWIKALQDL